MPLLPKAQSGDYFAAVGVNHGEGHGMWKHGLRSIEAIERRWQMNGRDAENPEGWAAISGGLAASNATRPASIWSSEVIPFTSAMPLQRHSQLGTN
jgi:hypothetical protein